MRQEKGDVGERMLGHDVSEGHFGGGRGCGIRTS